MTAKITNAQKKAALEALKELGTMAAAAKAAGVTSRTLHNEMTRSVVFKRRVLAAREQGYRNIGDNALAVIMSSAFNKDSGVDRTRLTAAIALANWTVDGFRGKTIVDGTVKHDVRVITAVPRPKYDELPAPKVKALESKTVESVIEGEIVKEEL